MTETGNVQRIPGYCALCTSKCGCISVVKDERMIALEPDPTHPTGQALCGKGRAAPELVHHDERLLYPLRRTRPKGEADPGWERISWDEALDTVASELNAIAAQHGPESVAFGITTPSGTGLQDAYSWVERLRHAFGSPNAVFGTEICNFHRDDVYAFTFGVGTPMPDFTNTDCILLWGHNPSATWLAYASRVAAAKARGAKLVVVDPRREGLANKSDQWLRVRPGSDGALALGLAHVLIESGNFDADFVRNWTNGPFLVREADGRLLRASDVAASADAAHRVAWDETSGGPVIYDPIAGAYETAGGRLALTGKLEVAGADGTTIACQPAFACYASLCREFTPEKVAELTWVPADEILATAELIGSAASVSCYTWSGVGQHTNASQTSRAIALLYALTGSFDAPGGNVLFDSLPVADLVGKELLPAAQAEKALGLVKRPAGPEAQGWITTDDLYHAILEGKPYPITGLMSFGTNMLLSHADSGRGRKALKKIRFAAHIDMFMTPPAEMADIVLPVNTPFEREGLCTDFSVGPDATSYVQLRPAAVKSRGESKSDLWIAFELAKRLGLANHFWGGDIDAGYRAVLEPSGLDLETLRRTPAGIHVPRDTRYRKYAETNGHGGPSGFNTPSRRVEIFSEMLQGIGQAPLPEFIEPAMSPLSQTETAAQFPLVLTSAKSIHYCHSQHRGLASLRRREPDPLVEIHPDAADARGIANGDWIRLTTPHGEMRARARFKKHLDPRVVSATAGWWQACAALDLPGFDAMAEDGANLNGVVSNEASDPISGSVPHRSYLCEIGPLTKPVAEAVAKT